MQNYSEIYKKISKHTIVKSFFNIESFSIRVFQYKISHQEGENSALASRFLLGAT